MMKGVDDYYDNDEHEKSDENKSYKEGVIQEQMRDSTTNIKMQLHRSICVYRYFVLVYK